MPKAAGMKAGLYPCARGKNTASFPCYVIRITELHAKACQNENC